jgi:transposase InsO family protein
VTVYPFIEAERAQQRSVKRACELLEVSRAAYYTHHAGTLSARQRTDEELTEHIRQAHQAAKGRYGAPRIHAELRRRGHRHGRKRVARLMRAAGLCGRTPRRFKRTTVPDPAAAARADLIRRDFAVNAAAVNTRWCGDITYLPTWEGWLYLATVIDIASRRVVGFALAERLRTSLVADALTNAVAARDPVPGVIFHSDKGCQYTSGDYAPLADDLEVALSTGRTGQCWDCDDPPALPRSA